MSKKGSSSASNDPFGGFAALMQAQAAGQQMRLGQDWLAFAKEQFAVGNERQKGIDDLTAKVTSQQLADMERAAGWATDDRARYTGTFQPLQDEFIKRANEWDSADAQANAAAEAKADVLSNATTQKAAGERALAARGIIPGSGAYAGIDRAAATQTALGAAGAQNQARSILRREGMGLQGDALNIGAGLPSQALDASKTGLGAGNYAAANQLGAEGNWRGNIGIMNTGFEGAGGLYNNAGKAWGSIYDNRVNLLNKQDQMASSGMNALLGGIGTAAGLGYGIYKSDRESKEDRKKARGILSAIRDMPIETWRYKEGEGPDRDTHIGPMAQDWKAATGLGDGKSIDAISAIGLTMGAVKELSEKVDRMSGNKAPRERSILKAA